MSKYGLKPVFGGASLRTDRGPYNDPETVQKLYQILEENGCETIDSARIYGDSETWLGKTKAGERFTIDSKTNGALKKGESSATGIPIVAKESVEKTGVKQLDIYYIHAPDDTLTMEEMMKGMNEAHKKGYFRRVGLSNFTTEQVQEAYDVCKKHGWVAPSVFQGNYNAVARRYDTELLPTLRKLNMAFYAYSPIAGGFLTKTVEQLTGDAQGAGRFQEGHVLKAMYSHLYSSKDSYLKALKMWGEAAAAAGCSKAELAYRWVAFDSALDSKYGDAIIFGSSKLEQVSQNLEWLQKGSVGAEARAKIDEIWRTIEHEAPIDNYNDFIKNQ